MRGKKFNPGAIVLVIAILAGLSSGSLAQDTHSRYRSPQGGRSLTLPEDSVIAVQMNATLTSRTAHVGDKFTATVTVPVYIDGATVIPAGSIIEGRITQVTPAKRMSRSGSIAVDFDDLVLPDGNRIRIVGVLTSDDSRTRRRIDDEGRISPDGERSKIVFIGGGGAVGAVLGGIAGGAKGAALGGIFGAGAGVAGVLLSKGEEAVVPSGTPFGVQLKQPLTLGEASIGSNGGADQFPTQADDPNSARPQPRDSRPYDRSTGDSGPPDLRRPNRPVGEPTQSDDSNSADPQPRDSRPYDRSTGDPGPPDLNRSNRPVGDPPVDSRTVEQPPSTEDDRPATEAPEATAPDLPLSSPEMIRKAQASLKEQGYYEGQIDGTMSGRTSAALKTYQREHKLPETGELDQQSANSLGLYKAASRDRAPARDTSRDPGPARQPSRDENRIDPSGDRASASVPDSRTVSRSTGDVVLANVSSASASRTADGGIHVLINTQANTGGWKWFGDKVVNGDTLEVYARAVKPTGMVTQVLSRGRIELDVTEDVENVRRVVVHSNNGDQVIGLDRASGTGPAVPSDRPVAAGPVSSGPVANLQSQADDLLSHYQRLCGVRLTGSGIEVDNGAKYGESEIELLFAIDGFANAAQLYSRLMNSLRDSQSRREATLDLARQARRTDRVISTSNSRVAGSLATRWDPIRQDVLRLMKSYNISASEIDND
jgi:hypothetical protein